MQRQREGLQQQKHKAERCIARSIFRSNFDTSLAVFSDTFFSLFSQVKTELVILGGDENYVHSPRANTSGSSLFDWLRSFKTNKKMSTTEFF